MKKFYLSELQNIRPQLDREFDFGHYVKILKMTSHMEGLADRAIGYKQNFFPDRWAILAEEPCSSSQFIDGDPSGAIRFLVDALLLYLGYTVRFGPLIHLKQKTIDTYETGVFMTSGLHLDKPYPYDKTDLSMTNAKEIKSVFEKLIVNYNIDLINIALPFYRRSCEIKAIPSESLLMSTIAMEVLFLKNDNQKAKTLAFRCGTFLGNKTQFNSNDIYREVSSIYKIRNAIVHDGISNPKIKITDKSSSNTWTLDCVTARDNSLNYLRQSLIAVLDITPTNKKDFLKQVKRLSTTPSKTDYKWQYI